MSPNPKSSYDDSMTLNGRVLSFLHIVQILYILSSQMCTDLFTQAWTMLSPPLAVGLSLG